MGYFWGFRVKLCLNVDRELLADDRVLLEPNEVCWSRKNVKLCSAGLGLRNAVLHNPLTYTVLTENKASQFLTRHRRANSIFEESKKGNLERECIEELCSKEEAREIFENIPETEYFYPKYVGCLGSHRVGITVPHAEPGVPPDLRTCVQEISNQCLPLPCHKEGYERCIDGQGTYTCVCKPGWNGPRCAEDIDECEDPTFLAGCNQQCSNLPGSYRCSCRDGYYLHDKIYCTDINECRLYPSICEEPARCVNTQGTFECQCPFGYKYNFTSRECQDVDECESHVCGEECVNTPGSFRCFCDGRQGKKLGQDMKSCEPIEPCLAPDMKRNSRSLYLGRMFSGIPVVKLRFRRRVHTGFTAEFDLRTYDSEGVIFFAGGHLNSSWIVLAIHHGKLELQLKYGAVSRVTSSGPLVNDGQWHKISVEEQGRSLVIKIDKEAVMKIAVNGDLFTLKKGMHELNLTVGGVPFKEDGLVNKVNPRLDACMRDWHWLTGEDTSIQETIRNNERMQCYSSENHSSFYPGHGFAYFNHSHGDTQMLSIQLTIRPTSTIGVLLALVRQDHVPLSISLSTYHSGKKEWAEHILVSFGDVIVASTPVDLCDSEIHTINVTVSGNSTILEVDGQLGLTEPVEHLESLDLSSSYSTFIGGIPDVSLVSTPVSAFYTGCMDVMVNGQLLDLDEAQHKHNDIRSHACPLVVLGN
uniref:Growth arrest-specific 6 n=1 Tax=Pygocentrus nattereri TaxID=42514 RepID=A0AAR2L688_PYGNA